MQVSRRHDLCRTLFFSRVWDMVLPDQTGHCFFLCHDKQTRGHVPEHSVCARECERPEGGHETSTRMGWAAIAGGQLGQ